MGYAACQLIDSEPVPAYLPTFIPPVIAKNGIKSAVVYHDATGCGVSLYYSELAGDATFAGMVSGSVNTFSSLRGTSKVMLADGTTALFRAVSCGGSCAPANLWWQKGGFEYQLQLNFASDFDEVRQ